MSYTEHSMVHLGIAISDRQGAAVLIRNGHMVASALEDRPGRQRQNPSLPLRAIDHCLRQADLKTLSEVESVILPSSQALAVGDIFSSSMDSSHGIMNALWELPVSLKEEIIHRWGVRQELFDLEGMRVTNVSYAEEDSALAAGWFSLQNRPRAALLQMDFSQTQRDSKLWLFDREGSEVIWSADYPHTLSHLVTNLAYFCGFRGRRGERQYLDLAKYGESRFEGALNDLLQISSDGAIQLDLNRLVAEPPMENEFTGLSQIFGGKLREPTAPITSRELDISFALVTRIEDVICSWRSAAQKMGAPIVVPMPSGPSADVLKKRLNQATTPLVQWVSDKERVLWTALGLALSPQQDEFMNNQMPMADQLAKTKRHFGSGIASTTSLVLS